MDPLTGRPLFATPAPPPYQSFELHPKAFTPRQCERIVAYGTSLSATAGALEGGDGSTVNDDSIRRSSTAWIPPHDDTWWIYDKLAKLAERANRRYGFELTGFGEDLQFTTYDEPGSFYSWHQDGLDGEVANRKLSIVVQLTDPGEYAGGEIQFFDLVEDDDDERLDVVTEVSRQQGTAIVFPAFEYHRVLPMRWGVRHSLVAWVTGPPFR